MGITAVSQVIDDITHDIIEEPAGIFTFRLLDLTIARASFSELVNILITSIIFSSDTLRAAH